MATRRNVRRKSINDINAQMLRIERAMGGVYYNSAVDEFEANNPRMQLRYMRANRAAANYIRNIQNSPSGDRSIIASNNALWSLGRNADQRARDINERFKNRKYSQNIYRGMRTSFGSKG